MVWHGTFQDITERKEYINTLEQILFDISHVVRKPVANIIGLISALEEYDLDPEDRQEYISHLKAASEEMDNYIKNLNRVYSERKSKAIKNNNIPTSEKVKEELQKPEQGIERSSLEMIKQNIKN